MDCYIRINQRGVEEVDVSGETRVFAHYTVYSSGIPAASVDAIAAAYTDGSLPDLLSDAQYGNFSLIIVDTEEKSVAVYNDHFGSNNIMIQQTNNQLIVTSDARRLFVDAKPELDPYAVYELTVFLDVQPPRTIYKNVHTVAAGHYAFSTVDTFSHKRYWHIETLFTKKNQSYDAFVAEVRTALKNQIKKQSPDTVAIGLSGGVDSGGLLGMATNALGKSIPSVSVGGHGPSSSDLINARVSAAQHNSPNIEVYPSFADFEKYTHYAKGLNQPLQPDMALVFGLVFDTAAKKHQANGVILGVGAEMLLGNLKICKLAYYLDPVERIVPHFILKPIYKAFARIAGLSKNQTGFLVSLNWIERFMHARGAFYHWKLPFFKQIRKEQSVWQFVIDNIASQDITKGVSTIDRLTSMYVFSWVNYIQFRDMTALGKRFGVRPVIPFDSLETATTMFAIPTKYRKRNNWNKQMVRDVFQPYVAPEVYEGLVGSLIVPYTKLIKGNESRFFTYLKSHTMICDLFDIDAIEAQYDSLPEPGFFLWRLVGLGVWYDTNYDETHLEKFHAIFNAK